MPLAPWRPDEHALAVVLTCKAGVRLTPGNEPLSADGGVDPGIDVEGSDLVLLTAVVVEDDRRVR